MNATDRRSVSWGYVILAIIVAIGLGVGVVRMINGLGTTTSLSDGYPWGLWILYDVFFVSFSAGAFMILIVTHIYGRHEYHTIARPVVLAGFLGEIGVLAVLVMDLGRWQQFYNVLFPWYWNPRSFMFQISICLTIYMGIMVLEVAPAILERLGWRTPLRLIKTLTVVIATAGIVLSTLHQSSLGSLFLMVPYKLHPLWWSPMLPLLFFASAACSGLAMAIMIVVLGYKAFNRSLDLTPMIRLAKILVALLAVYLLLKVADLVIAGEVGLLFTEGWLSVLFWAEIVLGVVIPIVLFGIPKVRDNSAGLLWGSVCVLAGTALNRTNVALIAYQAPGGATYFPNWMEIMIAVAAVAAGILLFALAVRFLPILPESGQEQPSSETPGWSRRTLVFVTGALVLLTVAVVLLLQPLTQAQASKAQPVPTSQSPGVYEATSCAGCHLDSEALLAAGADPEALDRLVVDPQPPEVSHGHICCVTCHYGDRKAQDQETAHKGLVLDPTTGEAHVCVACHGEVPSEFPEDRLRTPHDQLTHGEPADVRCSDCHGGVGHGFDPVSHGVICPMGVCMDCHTERGLDSSLSDCDTCHIGPHEPAPAMDCNTCHQSTETWQPEGTETHSPPLEGAHAEAQCLDCHQKVGSGQSMDASCASCHEPPDAHYGAQCEDCHTTAGFEDARLPAEVHPLPLEGAHQNASCEGCHVEGQEVPDLTVCSNCHVRPGGHLPGECALCHTPQGWAQSISFVVNLSPRITHELEGRDTCLVCHDPAGEMMPAPVNHGDYVDSQCVLCHKLEE